MSVLPLSIGCSLQLLLSKPFRPSDPVDLNFTSLMKNSALSAPRQTSSPLPASNPTPSILICPHISPLWVFLIPFLRTTSFPALLLVSLSPNFFYLIRAFLFGLPCRRKMTISLLPPTTVDLQAELLSSSEFQDAQSHCPAPSPLCPNLFFHRSPLSIYGLC